MPFNVSWHNLLDQLDDLPEGAELVTPLSNKRFRVTDVQEHRVVIEDDEEVLEILEKEGVDTDRVLSVDRDKLDQVLDVTTIPESEVYEIEESEYVRKAEVDEEVKETRLQGFKNRLATSDDLEAEELRQEIEALENRIEKLTEFKSGQAFHTQSGAEP